VPVIASVGGAVAAGAGHVVSGIVGDGISAVFGAASQWVASGAVWLLGQVGRAMSDSTTVDLTSGWFSAHLSVMAAIAAAVVLPMVCCATIQALYRQSAAMLVRTFLVQLPLALLLTGVVVELVQMALAVTDALSAEVLSSTGVDATNILAPVSGFLAGAGVVDPAVPAFVVFVGGLLVALAALGLWLELVVRAAAVSVAVLFLPLALAAMVWPAVSHWCRRLADTLVALVLSKLVIAAVLALAVGALAGGLGVGTTGGDDGGFSAVVTGIALLGIATVSPFTLLRLIPALEAGAAAHLESGRRHLASAAWAPVEAGDFALSVAKGKPESPTAESAGTSGGAGLAGTGPTGAAGAAVAAATGGTAGVVATDSSAAKAATDGGGSGATDGTRGTGPTFTGVDVDSMPPNEAHVWRLARESNRAASTAATSPGEDSGGGDVGSGAGP
jgi:hypothetical protein